LSTFFHFSIPTPVILSDRRSSLLRVFVLWKGTGGFPALLNVSVFDGPNSVGPISPIDPTQPGRDGTGGFGDLVVGATRFDLATPHSVKFGIGVSLGFGFSGGDTDLTFTSAGADFM
jgi:hypothetical protein